MKARSLTYSLFISSLILFGTNGVVADGISLPSTQTVVFRTFFGGILLTAVFLLAGGRYRMPAQKTQMLYLLISGVSMGISWILLYEAYAEVGVGISSMAYYCGPAAVMVLSPFVFGEKLSARGMLGFVAVMAGAVMMCAEAVGDGGNLKGYLLGFASAAAHAAMVIFSKLAKDIDGLENSSLQLLFAFAAVSAYAAAVSEIPSDVPAGDWPYILLLGFANTGIGCFLYFSTIVKLSAQTVSVAGYLEPLSAVVFSALLLGETMTGLQILGAAMIISGAVYAETRRSDGGRFFRTRVRRTHNR